MQGIHVKQDCPSFDVVVGRLGEVWIAYLKDCLNS